jgi:hypothetical protein
VQKSTIIIYIGYYKDKKGIRASRASSHQIMPGSDVSPGPQIMLRASSALQRPSPSNRAAGSGWNGLAIMSVDETMRFKHQTNRNAGPFRQQKPDSVQCLAESKSAWKESCTPTPVQ